jgi:uncharacterized protein
LWKLKYGDCSLSNIEREVLGVRRTGDIPGEEIPRTYFQFVRGGDPRKMLPVLTHNLIDVVSMAALIGRVTEQLGKTSTEALDPIELYSLGRIHLKKGAIEQASLFLQNQDPELLPVRFYLRSRKELSLAYKRKGQWDKAVQLWLETVESFEIGFVTDDPDGYDLFAYEELAKYFEHRQKDFRQAIRFVSKALDVAERLQQPELEPVLRHRLERLEKKLKINLDSCFREE